MNIAFFIAEMRPSGVATFVIELGAFLARTGHTRIFKPPGMSPVWRIGLAGLCVLISTSACTIN